MWNLKHTHATMARVNFTVFGLMFTLNAMLAQVRVIPVVFHVLHDNGFENIPDVQIHDQIAHLNTVFGNYPTIPTFPPFDAIVASMDVQFCLASLDPNGEPTTGIERIQTELTDHGGTPASYMQQWPPERYLNVWTVGQIEFLGVAFIALLPSEAELEPEMDGIMIRHNFVGRIGTSNITNGTGTLTRFARYLNLKMMCEDPIGVDDCHDDEVADTPPCDPLVACTPDQESCEPGVPVNAQNYMNFSSCKSMFTLGQRERVHACLNSNIAQRNSLWTDQNLALTGCGAPLGTAEYPDGRGPTVYPNPFSDELTITGLSDGPVDIELVDALGRKVRTEQRFVFSSEPIRLSGYNSLLNGAYWMRITSPGELGSTKLLMKH